MMPPTIYTSKENPKMAKSSSISTKRKHPINRKTKLKIKKTKNERARSKIYLFHVPLWKVEDSLVAARDFNEWARTGLP